MKEERLKILTMLQEGKITPEEAEKLLAALSGSGRSESTDWTGRGRRARGCWDFDFDFTRNFEPDLRRFGPIFDEEFRRKFQDKMRSFRHSMRWADENTRREARDGLREAADAVKKAFESSNIKETIESVGKTVLDAMEEAMRRFGSTDKSGEQKSGAKSDSTEEQRKQDGDSGTFV